MSGASCGRPVHSHRRDEGDSAWPIHAGGLEAPGSNPVRFETAVRLEMICVTRSSRACTRSRMLGPEAVE
ncbi:unnamed protein product [Protopolystoma xenopodis]|uniref:Uncharacterized protein n=1 Tax=Protopolystoma xenopodis TaxID=117903 RepID=A0A3S5AXE0_9PLAT|nr:unnamed protein product [Protopolystoma xenopodis]